MLPLGILRPRHFAVGNAATLAIYAGLGSATLFVVLFLQQVGGYSAFAAGATLTPIILLLIGLSSRFGAIATRIGTPPVHGLRADRGGPRLLLLLRLDAEVD